MTWAPIAPPPPRSHRAIAAVVLTVSNAALSRQQTTMLLTVRTDMLEGGLDWWRAGATVAVAVGHGEHAGMLRITPGGAWKLSTKGNPKSGSVSVLRLPLPHGAPAEGCNRLPLDYDHSIAWLEVTLPDWARELEPEAFTKRLPYIGICAREPDPATTLQAIRGGRVR